MALLVALAVFGPSVRAPWLWDDLTLIRDSPVLDHPDQLGRALTEDLWMISANPRAQGMYRPVVTASYFLDRAVFGASPLGPHVVNLLLHLLTCVLLARLAWRLGASPLEAVFAAALFGFHPATVEAVANVSSRGDLFAAVFLLLALLALRKPGPGGLGLSALSVALALLSKEAAFVALPLALVVEWWGAGRLDRARWFVISVALGVVSGAVLVLRRVLLGSAVMLSSDDAWRPVLSGASGVVRYFSRVVWPSPLVAYQPPTVAAWWSVVVLALLVGLAVLQRGARPWVTLGLAWFLVATAPIAGWLPVAVRFSGLLLYLPLLGVALAAARGLQHVRVRWGLPALGAVLCVLQVTTWSSARALWQANVDAYPELVAPQLNLANALSAEGESQLAFEAYGATITVATQANDPKSLALAELGLGNLLLPSAPDAAEAHFLRAVTVSEFRLWQASLNLAVALSRQGKEDDARAVLERQWAARPNARIAELGLQLARTDDDKARWASRAPKPP